MASFLISSPDLHSCMALPVGIYTIVQCIIVASLFVLRGLQTRIKFLCERRIIDTGNLLVREGRGG